MASRPTRRTSNHEPEKSAHSPQGEERQRFEAHLLQNLEYVARHRVDYAGKMAPGWPDREVGMLNTEEGFVRKHGRFFTAQPLPKEYPRMKSKKCFFNCMAAAIGQDLIYVEGFALLSIIPMAVHHAWCSDAKGMVYDFTWLDIGMAYFGVPFKTAYVAEEQRRQLEEDNRACLIRCEREGFCPAGSPRVWRHPSVGRMVPEALTGSHSTKGSKNPGRRGKK